MSWLSSFLNPGKGYEKGQEQLDKYYNQAQGALQPYNQNGQDQYANLQEMLKNLMDPQALQDKWASGYKESEAAKNAEGIAQEHGLDAASSMGLMGSNTAINAIQRGTSQIGAEDKQSYLDQLMDKYKQAVGLSSGIYGQGANAAGIQSNNSMNMGQNSANMAYGKQNAGGSMLEKLLGTAVGAAGSALGGPIGGALAKRWNLSGGA
jgi:hypothetical protein